MPECVISDEWKFRGIDAVVLENSEVKVVVLSGKGTDISEITYKPQNLNLLFRNNWGPRNPRLFPPTSPHREEFRDYTGGGWSDILPNAGAACANKGAILGLHDETPLLEWSSEILSNSSSEVIARFCVDLNKFPFSVEKTISLNQTNLLTIEETVNNRSRQDLPFSWLIHPTFSWEFANSAEILLEANKIFRVWGSKVDESDFPMFRELDGSLNQDVRVVPSGDAQLNDTTVIGGLDVGKYSIENHSLGLEFTLEWPKDIFPYLWYYRCINAPDYPYYGRSKFIALEPCTSLRSGLETQVISGDNAVLPAGSSVTASIRAKVSTS